MPTTQRCVRISVLRHSPCVSARCGHNLLLADPSAPGLGIWWFSEEVRPGLAATWQRTRLFSLLEMCSICCACALTAGSFQKGCLNRRLRHCPCSQKCEDRSVCRARAWALPHSERAFSCTTVPFFPIVGFCVDL